MELSLSKSGKINLSDLKREINLFIYNKKQKSFFKGFKKRKKALKHYKGKKLAALLYNTGNFNYIINNK